GVIACDEQSPRLPKERIPLLDLRNHLEFVQAVLEHFAVWNVGEVERAGAEGPGADVALGSSTHGISPSVGGVVESTGVDSRPVEKICPRIVGVLIRIEHIGHGKFADREYPAVDALRPAKLAGAPLHRLPIAAGIERLAYKPSRHTEIRMIGAHLVGLAARKSGYAQRVVESKALIDLRLHPGFRSPPETRAEEETDIRSFPVGAR